MAHVALLGDSIFDNAAYVPQGLPVVDQLRCVLPAGSEVTLLAVDGDSAADIGRQLDGLPAAATHLFMSVGGNDAYNASGVLGEVVASVADALGLLAAAQAKFQTDYGMALSAMMRVGKPWAVCTVYDSIPGLGEVERTALALFNDVILRSAFASAVPVIDLRRVCNQAADYSEVSPIEPSEAGGAKIARVIAEVLVKHDFSCARSSVYA